MAQVARLLFLLATINSASGPAAARAAASATPGVPTSAITYEEGRPVVKVVGSLTDEQRQQVEKLGIVRTTEAELATYPVTVKLGVAGRFYTEIVSGLEEGTLIVTTATALQSETGSAVQQGFGPPNGHNFQGGNSPRAR